MNVCTFPRSIDSRQSRWRCEWELFSWGNTCINARNGRRCRTQVWSCVCVVCSETANQHWCFGDSTTWVPYVWVGVGQESCLWAIQIKCFMCCKQAGAIEIITSFSVHTSIGVCLSLSLFVFIIMLSYPGLISNLTIGECATCKCTAVSARGF